MNSEDRKNLAKVRYERAEELLKSANTLLKAEDYKSANNRAFYCAEQAKHILEKVYVYLKDNGVFE